MRSCGWVDCGRAVLGSPSLHALANGQDAACRTAPPRTQGGGHQRAARRPRVAVCENRPLRHNAAMRVDAEPLTTWIRAAGGGDREAAGRAYRLLYPELRKIARSRLRGQAPDTLLDTEGLVHETFMRMVGVGRLDVASRNHFYAYAATTMRHIVVDFVRRKRAQRRGGDDEKVTLDTALIDSLPEAQGVLAVEQALQSLEALDPKLAQVVEMRYFGGYGDAEIAQAMGLTDRTVRRYWIKARAFMLAQLQS